jgi:RNA polymerase sigma-70 factor (ECF subfamily)
MRLREGRSRFVVSPEAKERLLRRFLVALESDDQNGMLALVADDATWTSDGGGRVRSARRVVRGAMRVVRLALGLERKWRPRVPLRHELDWINGEPAVATYVGQALVSTMSIDVEGEQIAAFYRVVNPDKVRRLARRRASGRRDALASPA